MWRWLVCKHRGEFAFIGCGDDQSRMHGNKAAGKRKGVERRILDDEKFEVIAF
jgi:hypothetical protein